MNTEQMYQEFTSKILPKINDGISITKDYFLDLFGRYVKYLIITDIFLLCMHVLLIIVSVVVWQKAKGWIKEEIYGYGMSPVLTIMGIVMGIILGVVGTFIFSVHLIKVLYIPEVVVYESLTKTQL